MLVPLATRFCQLGLAGALLTCFFPDVALKISRKRDGAQASGKGTKLAPHGYVAGLLPGLHEIQYGWRFQALLMLLEAENTQCPGPGAWLTLLGQESGEQM